MSALTLVMKELAGLDPEEFVHLRAYHSCGGNYKRRLPPRDRIPSPVITESSGIGSLSGSEDDSSESHVEDKTLDLEKRDGTDVRIDYQGRNLLDLNSNLKPARWQVKSPLMGKLSPDTPLGGFFFKLTDFSKGTGEYEMNQCEMCEFQQPLHGS